MFNLCTPKEKKTFRFDMHTTFAKKIGTFWQQANVKQRAIYWHILVNVCHLLNGPNFKSRTVTKQFRNRLKIFELNVLLQKKNEACDSLNNSSSLKLYYSMVRVALGVLQSSAFVWSEQNTVITVRLFDCRAVSLRSLLQHTKALKENLWQRKRLFIWSER